MIRLLTVWIMLIVATATAACGGDEEQEASQPARSTTVVQTEEQQADEAATQQAEQQAVPEQEQEQPAPPPNQAPIADAGENQRMGLIPSTINLSARRSRDPDGDALTYQWRQIRGEPVELRHDSRGAEAVSFVKPATEQSLVFEVTVTDPSGESDSDTVAIFLQNSAPTADAGKDIQVDLNVELVQLSGSGSFDPDEEQLTYSWEQTFGPEIQLVKDDASPSEATFTPLGEEGVVTFVLTVTDPHGATDSARVNVSFKEKSPSEAESSNGETTTSASAFSPKISHQPNESFTAYPNGILYKAFSDPDTGNVNTQISLEGIYGNLTLDLVCTQRQGLAGLKMHDPLARLAGHSEGDLLFVGLSGAGNLRSLWMVIYIVDIPALCYRKPLTGFLRYGSDWSRAEG